MLQRSLLAAALSLVLGHGVLGCSASAADPPPASSSQTVTSGAASAPGSGAANVPGSTTFSGTPASTAPGSATAAARSVPASSADVRALAEHPPRPADGKGAGLAGPVDSALDSGWITRLATAEITELTANRGGGSVSLKARFADGKKAAIKLEQTGHPTDPRAEIAAYHVDRLLGFGRTAVVVGRSFALADLRAALVAGKAEPAFLDRLDKLVVTPDGRVAAAMVAWHTASLVEEAVAPTWADALNTKDPVAPDLLSRVSEWSDLVVFDFLIDNPDRFSGGNILRLDRKGPLVFLDQGAAFGKNRLKEKLTTKDRLEKVCRFQTGTLAALARATPAPGKGETLGEQLGKSLSTDPLAPVLDAAQLAGLDERARALTGHVRACKGRLGAASTLQ